MVFSPILGHKIPTKKCAFVDKKIAIFFCYLWNCMKRFFQLVLASAFCLISTSSILAQRVDSIDVLHYNLNVNLQSISSKQISGQTELVCRPKYNGVQTVILDLQKLSVSSITANKQNAVFTQTDSTIRIQLPSSISITDTLKLNVSYSGSPVLDGRWGGFYFSGNYAFNMGVGMASNPPNFGRCWFPCIDNFVDRATYEFHITTDTGYMAVCSGLQEPASFPTSATITWNWKLNQSIPTYIANVAVSKYVLINSSYAGIQRNIPVQLAVDARDTAKAIASFAKLNQALTCFESKFGPYLFDRVGYVGVPFNSGAMEHACNISYPLYAVDGSANYETLMAHELSHHWFGNLATTRTAADMWLNEGWASYCEALFLECVYGRDAYDDKIKGELFEVLRWAHARDEGYKSVSGVPLPQTYGTHVYTKGSLMVHSLRILINDDTAFFNTCKSYLEANRFKDVSSIDLQKHFEKRFGGMITKFFQSYIFDKGHVDLQLIDMKNVSMGDWSTYVPVFKLMSRYKTYIPDTIIAYYGFYQGASVVNADYYRLIRNPFTDTYTGPAVLAPGEYAEPSLGDKCGTMLGTTMQMSYVKGTSVQNFTNALFTFTPQTNPDSTLVVVEHHFAGPWQDPSLYPKGIRVSSERFWKISGNFNPNFKSTAFFNYDGSTLNKSAGHLDNELIVGTEDSLVLLYRPNAKSPFMVETDLTKQMGSNKTDKTGRFWVNNLKKGEYVFGYKDFSAGLNQMGADKRSMLIFPNPADTELNIHLPANHGKGVIRIWNPASDLILELDVTKDDKELEMKVDDHLSKGTYFIVYSDALGKISQTFIVK